MLGGCRRLYVVAVDGCAGFPSFCKLIVRIREESVNYNTMRFF